MLSSPGNIIIFFNLCDSDKSSGRVKDSPGGIFISGIDLPVPLDEAFSINSMFNISATCEGRSLSVTLTVKALPASSVYGKLGKDDEPLPT
jgi:hypothetical protein